jgi:hypothetical protein
MENSTEHRVFNFLQGPMIRENHHDPTLREERDTGRNLEDKAVFEINYSSSSIDWANDFALEKLGYTLDQITSMSIFDLSPERFHEKIREDMASDARDRERRFSILPLRSMTGLVSWWYVYKIKSSLPKKWMSAEHLQDTAMIGPEFTFMCLQMDALNYHADLELRMDDLESWVQHQVDRVDRDIHTIKDKVDSVGVKTDHAVTAAKNAAQHSLDAKNASLAVQSEFKSQFQKFEDSQVGHTAEILRLIGMDSILDMRVKSFEEHVKLTTEDAVKAIEAQADSSGKGLSRKITIPIGVLVGLATVVQVVISNWDRIIKLIQ